MNSLKVWDICNIANEAKRASTISFSVAYCEIEATYMVPSGSSITRLDQGSDFVFQIFSQSSQIFSQRSVNFRMTF
jgi:hypothetical protein